jgi:hypothetical protein
MKTESKKFRYQTSIKHIGILLFVLMGMGCASTHKMTKTETTVTYPNDTVAQEREQKAAATILTSGEEQNRGVEKTETTTTTTETKSEHPGIISSTLHAVGYVISLPFIVVGGLFRIMFGG